MHKVLIKTGMNVHIFTDQWVKLENRDSRMWQMEPESCVVCLLVCAWVCVSAHGFHWVCATSLYWLCLRICVCVCVRVCVCESELTCSAAAQHKLTTFIRSLCLSCHIKTPHYLLLCHCNSDCSFFTINLLNMLSLFLSLLFTLFVSLLSLGSLCHQLLRQCWVTISSFSFETVI